MNDFVSCRPHWLRLSHSPLGGNRKRFCSRRSFDPGESASGFGLAGTTVLPSAYLPPVSWFRALAHSDTALVEQYEHYQKQTIRNRCAIDSPNGRLYLSIPVDRGAFANGKCLMRDVRISSHTDWQRQHWYALETSYHNSPFFEYLSDDFRPLYERPWTFLIDFNEALISVCANLLDLDTPPARTTCYEGLTPYPTLRGDDAQRTDALRPYYQVFAHKHGFLPDLSVVDLLFNMGNESVLFLS